MSQSIRRIFIKLPLNYDILAGLFMLANFGQEKYPGVGEAPLEFLTNEPDTSKMAELQKQGGLFLGFNQNVDLISRLTEILGLADNPVIAQLKELAAGSSEKLKILTSIIERYVAHPDKVILIALPLLKTCLTGAGIWENELARLERENKMVRFTCYQGKKLIQATAVESEIAELDLWLIDKEAPVDMVVIKSASGVKISARLEKQIDLDNLAALLRIEEARKKRVPFDSLNKKQLAVSGQLGTILEWHYDQSARQIFSGDFGIVKTPLTFISFEELQELLKIGLNPVLIQEKYPKFF